MLIVHNEIIIACLCILLSLVSQHTFTGDKHIKKGADTLLMRSPRQPRNGNLFTRLLKKMPTPFGEDIN